MKRVLSFIAQIYGGLIKLYPLEFQKEFGEELQVVFSTMVGTAARKSKQALVLTCLQELCDFPILLVRTHLDENNMLKIFHSQPTRFAFRGAVGYSLGFAFVYFFLLGLLTGSHLCSTRWIMVG
jgi:hypothetical protein